MYECRILCAYSCTLFAFHHVDIASTRPNLALILVLLHLHVLNIGFLSHYPFLKTMFPSFLHHHCLQFLYPPSFSLENVFLYLSNLDM